MRSRPEIIRFHSCAKAGTAYSGRSRKILLRPHPNIPGAMKRCSASSQKIRPIHQKARSGGKLKEPCWFRPTSTRRHTDNRRVYKSVHPLLDEEALRDRATAQKVGTGSCFRSSYQDESPHSHCFQIAIIPFKISIRTGFIKKEETQKVRLAKRREYTLWQMEYGQLSRTGQHQESRNIFIRCPYPGYIQILLRRENIKEKGPYNLQL